MSWAEVFDELAATYDAETAEKWHPNPLVGELLDPLALQPRSILDLGAGTGQTASMLRALYPEAHLTLVDPSVRMLEVARVKHPEAATVVVGADEFLARDGERFDLVTAVGCLEMVSDLHSTVRAAVARLRPGGVLAFTIELLIDGNGTQGEPETVLAGGARVVRRYRATELDRLAASNGLEQGAAQEFVAFPRQDAHEDVLYRAVAWRRPGRTDLSGGRP